MDKPKSRKTSRRKPQTGGEIASTEVPRIEHDVVGEGDKTLIFIHSFLGNKGFWRMQLPCFVALNFRCIVCNLPGISQEFDPSLAGKPTIHLLARGILQLMEEYNLTDVILVGHSFGNRIVMETDSLVNDRISGLVLIDGDYASTGDHVRDEAILNAKIKAAGSFRDMILPFFMGMHFDPNHEDLQAQLLSGLTVCNRPESVKLYTSMVTWDADFFFQRLHETTTPILVLQSTMRTKEGQWKSLQPEEESPYQWLIKQHARYYRSVTVVGGHFPMLENPDGINAGIIEFLHLLATSEREVDRDLQEFLQSLGAPDTLEVDESLLMDDSILTGLPYSL